MRVEGGEESLRGEKRVGGEGEFGEGELERGKESLRGRRVGGGKVSWEGGRRVGGGKEHQGKELEGQSRVGVGKESRRGRRVGGGKRVEHVAFHQGISEFVLLHFYNVAK